MLNSIKTAIMLSPPLKSIFNSCNIVIPGALTGFFVNSMTVNNSIVWRDTFYNLYFWLCLFYLFFVIYYQYVVYKYETDPKSFINKSFVDNYMAEATIPIIAKKMKRAVKKGDYEELKTLQQLELELRKDGNYADTIEQKSEQSS